MSDDKSQPLMCRSGDMWRSMDELARTPAFREAVEREFGEGASTWADAISRRRFLKLMGASLALAGLSGCTRWPDNRIVPYVVPPEQVVPGLPLFYATAMPFNGCGQGVLVESHEGRPTKVEGNPEHPTTVGATNTFLQSSVLMLYDPDRSAAVLERDSISNWGAFVNAMTPHLQKQQASKGQGLRILTEPMYSPSLGALMQQVLQAFPAAKWHQYEPVNGDSAMEGTRLAMGRPMNAICRFDQARVIVALDSDFLMDLPGSLRYARQFIDARRVRDPGGQMNRLYVVEPTMTITGSMADHRLPLRAGLVAGAAQALAAALGVPGAQASTQLTAEQMRWIQVVAEDLRNAGGQAIVIAGPYQPPAVHALVHAINQSLGAAGKTVVFTEPLEIAPQNQMQSLKELVADMSGGRVQMLLIMGGNPAYNAPVDLNFAASLLTLSRNTDCFTARLGLYNDETSFLSQWQVPRNHYLESWGDVRAHDGTISIIQPLIAPLYGSSKSDYEFLAALIGRTDATNYDLVREYWQQHAGQGAFENFWQTMLERGVVANTAMPTQEGQGAAPAQAGAVATPPAEGLEIVFRPDYGVWDGSFANIGWQQELPRPFTRLTWDNAALMSPNTAKRLGVENSDVVELTYQGRAVHAPVWIVPGQADDVVVVPLGYGRERGGNIAAGAGFNAYALRTSQAPWFGSGLQVSRTGQRFFLVATHNHNTVAARPGASFRGAESVESATVSSEELEHSSNRKIMRVGTLELLRKTPNFVQRMGGDSLHLTMYPPYPYEGYKWGMVIDQNACIGCQACVIACQSENNIPVVGKEQVAAQREMHWLRVDNYYDGSLEEPRVYHQPVPCMHCENAPCEIVCPVNATVHDAEGINQMVYNRCVGTRYCSNNCPYKVRRFNFLQYSDTTHPTVKMQKNPDLSVRNRGVMEKCTYCIQRISEARIGADKRNGRIVDGEVKTACQQACPTGAIIFGDLNDAGAMVKRLNDSPLTYSLLEELTTQPRTRYMARLRNPNPAIERVSPA